MLKFELPCYSFKIYVVNLVLKDMLSISGTLYGNLVIIFKSDFVQHFHKINKLTLFKSKWSLLIQKLFFV